MLLREVQGEVLALQQDQVSAGSGSSGRDRQQQQPSTLMLTSPPGSGSSGSLLQSRTTASPSSAERSHRDSRNHAISGVKDGRIRVLALEEPESAREGFGTALKRPETTTDDASTAHNPRPRGSPSSSPLLLGWETADDGAGNTFYYNGSTGESRWDPPAPDVADASARVDKGDEEQALSEPREHDGGAAEAADEAERSHEDEALKQRVALPAGWEAVDADDGGVYYYHVASGATQWEVPHGTHHAASGHEEGGEEPVGDTSVPTATTDGVAGWEEFKTDEGVPFWYNAASDESCWELPGDRAG